MLPLGYNSLAEHEMKVLYRAWEGQLFIQNRRVCDIVLRSPFQASIPAQLPAKLEFKYIVRISELRKKLPEAAFKKTSYSNDEVCCQQLSFRLYQVEILDESELKDQLIGSMKEKKLALVKYLNDRGILLFLTSSVLAKEKDAEAKDLGSLQALFLFPAPGPRHLAATDWKREEGRSETPPPLPLVLPLLRRVLAGAAKNPNPKQSPSNALVKLHMEGLADLEPCSAPNCDNAAGQPLTSKLSSETPKGPPGDGTCSPSSFSNLAFYLSDPGSYTLEIASATAACLKGRSGWSDGDTGLNLDPSPSDEPDKAAGTGKSPFPGHGPSRETASKSSPAGELSLQWTKRKSSRILGASSKKKWSPLKMYCILESSKKKTKEKEKRKKKKKKKKKKLPKEVTTLNIPLAEDLGIPADPKKPTLKLKNILNPLRRKRGAEVLSAEFIQGPRIVSAGPTMEEKKPRLNVATKVKNVDKMDAKEATPRKTIHGVSSEKQRTEAAAVEKATVASDAHRISSRGEECDSHALNMLADLALSSCHSPLDGNNRRDFGRFRPSREHRLPRGKFLHKSSDHEYHRATKKRKSAFLPGQTSRSSLWPAKDGPLNAKDRSGANPVQKKKARTNLAKTSLALPNETGELSDSSTIISLDHSYASPVSETPQKAAPHSPNSRNVVKQDKPGPLVGKVLPFQHQQNNLSPARSTALANRLREEFATSRQVTSCDKTVQVTLQWEAKYVFDLDSKYTKDSLEKTIIRAVHGPWDGSLSDNLEDMKLILHMWMALFYGKPAPTLTIRKVVEHSNPAKYVSLNSLVEPLEDSGGPYVLEERLAASLPKAVPMPAEGGEDGSVSRPEKLLPGNKQSSTDSLEDESPLTKLEATKDLLEKEGLAPPPPKSIDEAVQAEPKEQTSLHPALPVENPPGADECANPPVCRTKADRSQETTLVETSQNEASAPTGPPEGSGNQEAIASTEVAVAVPDRGSDVASSSEEVKDNLPVGGPNPERSKEERLKADVESREPTNPGNGARNQPGLHAEERDGESVDLGSMDLLLSKSNDADLEVQDMDLVSEDEVDPLESGATGREETDGVSDDTSSVQSSLPPRASSLDSSYGHLTEFPSVQEAGVRLSSSSVCPSQMGLMDTVLQQETLLHSMTVDEKMVGSTSSCVSPNQKELKDTVLQQETSLHPVTVDEKMVGSTSASVSPSQMRLKDTVLQQETSFHPVTVDEKMVGSTSASVSSSQMRLKDTVLLQETSLHPVTVEEKMVGSTSASVSPSQMRLKDTVLQQETSLHPVTVDEKMVGSTSASVSPNQKELKDTVLQQETSLHPVTVDEKMVGSTSASVSSSQIRLKDTVLLQETSLHPVTVDEKMVGSTSASVSSSQMRLKDTVLQQETSLHPVTVDEKMVGSTSASVSPSQMRLKDTALLQETPLHPVTVDEKMVGSTSASVSPNQMRLKDTVLQQETSLHPVTVDEKMVGSTSASVSPNQKELKDTVLQQETSLHPVTVDEKKVGSTSASVSPSQLSLKDTVLLQETSLHPVTVDEKMVGSTSASVSPSQMRLKDTVLQQETSLHPVTVDEKKVGSTSASVSPSQMRLKDTVLLQETSLHPVTVDEKKVGSTSASVSPSQMRLKDTVLLQETSLHPVTVDEKMVGSTSASVSPSQMRLKDTVLQQETSLHPVTVDEKKVGSTSASVSPSQMRLKDTVLLQEISLHPVTVDEKKVGSTSASVSPNQKELKDTVLQQETSLHPVTVDEKKVGSTSASVSPSQLSLKDTVLQQETSLHPVTVDEKKVGSTSASVSPNQKELKDTVLQQETSLHPVTVDEKKVGSTSASESPSQMRLKDTVLLQETSLHPVTVDEKKVGSTSASVSPSQLSLKDTVLLQETSLHPVAVDEKMVGSTSASVSPSQMRLKDTVLLQETSLHPVTVDEKKVGSTSASVSPSQLRLKDTVLLQETSLHPVTVDEKMVGSTLASVSPSQMRLKDTVLQQETSLHPVTVDEKMVGSTSASVSPSQMMLMDTVLQQETSLHPVTVDEKMVGSTSASVSPSQLSLKDTVLLQKTSLHPVTVDEKKVGSTSGSVSPNQKKLMDTVLQQETSLHPLTVDEKMVGSTSASVSPSQMRLMDTVLQQETSLHPVTVDEKMVGSAMDPTSPKQTDVVENLHDEAILADSASTEVYRDFPNDGATPEGPLQGPQESAESPNPDVVDLPSVSQEDNGICLPCLPSWQASPVHQEASDEQPPRIQEDRPENPLYPFFQNPMGLIEDISQDSTDFADSAVQLYEPNNLCVNLCVPNSTSTRQESVENQDSSVAFAQHLPLTKEMDLVESSEGDHPASPVHQETSDEAATLPDDSGTKLDLLEGSSIPQQKDVIHPTDDVLGPVNEQQLEEFNSVAQEEQKINQGEKILVDSQPATEYPSLESPTPESETCLDQENLRDSFAREEEEEEVPNDSVEKPTATTTAIAKEIQVLMNELVDTVCARVAQSEEMRAPKSFGWIDSALLECVTPPVSDDEGCPTDQEEDLQARVEGRRESGSSSNENTTSDPGDVSEKVALQGNDATSAATGIFSSCGTSQADLDTTSPKSKCSWLETPESPDDYSAKVDDYNVSTLEKVGQTEASPEEPICNREDCSRGEDVGNSSFVQAKCQEDSLAEEPDSLVDRDSNEAPEYREEEAQEEAKGCVGSLEDPLPDERTEMSTSSSGTDTYLEDESWTVDGGKDPCVDWYTTRTFESWCQPRIRASPSVESELTHSSVPGNETCKDGDWVSSEASQKTSDAGSMKRKVPFGLKKGCLWSGHTDRKPKPFKDYINFSITKRHKEKSRIFHSFSKEHHPFPRDLGSINSWSRNWGILSDPIQNILDVESLQFHCRIQALLKKSQRSTSRVLPSKKVPPQAIAEGLLPGTVSEGTIARFPTRSKSPLLVTVVNPNPRTGGRYNDIYGQFPASPHPLAPAIASRSRGGLGPKYPFPSSHLQKLTHPTRNSFSRDISSVLEEFAEFSRVMTLESTRTRTPNRDPIATSGKASEIRYPPRPPMPLVYEDLLAELRNALHFQLTNVAQEACRKSFSFYLMETEDDLFFGRVKNLLKKAGHPEVDPLHFCKGSGLETENLLVIVRNEDICSHIHKVPCLLHLKRCPNVTFAGVDIPEDPLDHTYQQLFHSGGFVVSDDNVLEGMSVGELKDVIKTLEKLNCHGRWKWFLHYRESKKLKEDARGDLAAYAKESVLKSCQVAKMTEVLHYHKCDSRSCTRFERFTCLLNLQIQHITKRFGIFLTENASASREALEDKGIFGLNITDFITSAQSMVAPSGRGFW